MPLRQLVQPKLKKPLTQELSSGFGLVATGELKPGQVQVPEDATLYAPLIINPQDYASRARHTVTRDSVAVRNRSGTLRLVNANAPRHESAGLLMEPASTNKCQNYNANVDAALVNLTLAGGGGATMERVSDVEVLRASGLGDIGNGFVVKIINPGSTVRVDIEGVVGNLNPHAVSMYWRGEKSGDRGGIRLSGTGEANEQAPFTYERFSQVLTPTATDEIAQVLIQPGATLYFLLNQLEEQPVPTSVIITEGAAGVRALDGLQWFLASQPYGSDVIVNGQFETDSDWTKEVGWTISNGKARYDGTDAFSRIFQTATTVGNFYELSFDCEVIRGKLQPRDGASIDLGDGAQVTGSYSEVFKSNADGRVIFGAAIGDDMERFEGTLDNVRCRQLTPILNQSEGMTAFLWRPQWAKANTTPNSVRSMLALTPSNSSWIHHVHSTPGNSYLEIKDGTNFRDVTLDADSGPVANDLYLVMARWRTTTPEMQIGYKKAGAYTWGTVGPYDGSFSEDGLLRLAYAVTLPEYYRDVYVWNEDKGTAWLESFFSGVAN